MFASDKAVLTLTEKAAQRVRTLMDKSGSDVLGLRVGISNKGCSGLSYVVEYANEQKQFEEVVESHGVKIFIDPAAIMFLIGAEMDYFETKLENGFTFKNPNETARCGCGESFSVS